MTLDNKKTGSSSAQLSSKIGGKRLKPYTVKDFWNSWKDSIIFLMIVFLLFKVIFQLAYVPSGSMETTIPTKSLMICWRLPYFFGDPLPKHGEIITFQSDELSEVLVKRVIGLPGDEITFREGYVYRNDVQLDEPYLRAQGVTESGHSFMVPEGCVFFLGDNRTGSYDARKWYEPYIDRTKLQAKALVIISFGKDHSWQGVRLAAG